MINIVFLLLLFFLATGSLSNREETQATVPESHNLPMQRLPRLLLLLENDGRLLLDGQTVSRQELVAAAKRAIAATGRAGQPLSILAQRDMAASIFLGIAETLRANQVPLQIVTVHATPESGPAGP
jgi:biopolymer transport protein ExbD